VSYYDERESRTFLVDFCSGNVGYIGGSGDRPYDELKVRQLKSNVEMGNLALRANFTSIRGINRLGNFRL